VNENFDRLVDALYAASLAKGAPVISPDGRIPPIPAIATHDDERIQYAREAAARVGLPKSALEFQMLLGIRSDLQKQLAQEGYPVRVYVAYGTHWYPFFMRRLAERPANVWFLLSNLMRR
jgi:proline dehydrogenase